MGNIKGSKRGKYNKTKTKSNEKTIFKSSNKSTNGNTNATKFGEVVKRVQNNNLTEIDNSSEVEQTLVINDTSGVNQTNADVNGTFESKPQGEVFQQTSGEEKLNDFLDEYKQVNENETLSESTNTSNNSEPQQQQSSSTNNLKVLVNGYMLLTLMDIVFPVAIKFIFGMFNAKAKKVSINDMKLEPEQKQSLMDSADEVAKYIFEKVNPLTMFLIASLLFYGTNFQTALNNIKDEKK